MSNRLRDIVKQKMNQDKLSLRTAGDQVGVSHTTIDRVLKEKSVDLETVQKVCDWVGIPITNVLDINQANVEMVDEVAALISLNPELKKVLRKLDNNIKIGALNPIILSEIAAFISYRMHEKLIKKNSSKK